MTSMGRQKPAAAASAPKKSISCLASICHDVSGVERNTMSGCPDNFVETGAGDLRRKKIRDEPGLDALDFAELDDVFDALELRVLGADQHAADGMFVEQFDQHLGRRFGEVEFPGDFKFVAGCACSNFRSRAVSVRLPARMMRRLYWALATRLCRPPAAIPLSATRGRN